MAKTPLYACKSCDATFTIYSTYYSHIRKHKGPTINCTHCDEKFYVKSELYKHLGKVHVDTIQPQPPQPLLQPQPQVVKRNKLVCPLFME